MDNIAIHSEHVSGDEEIAPVTSLENKLEKMRKNIEHTKRYELLTTNQYLEQMELILEILYEITILKNHTSS